MKGKFTTEQLLEIAEKETSRLTNAEDREDAKQEFILGVLEAQERGDPEQDGYRSYLWSYGRGRVLSFLSKQTKYSFRHNREDVNLHEVSEKTDNTFVDCLSYTDDNTDEVVAREEQERLHAAIAALSTNRQMAIKEYFWNDRTLDDIGEIMGVTKERVRQIKSDALEQLQYALA